MIIPAMEPVLYLVWASVIHVPDAHVEVGLGGQGPALGALPHTLNLHQWCLGQVWAGVSMGKLKRIPQY